VYLSMQRVQWLYTRLEITDSMCTNPIHGDAKIKVQIYSVYSLYRESSCIVHTFGYNGDNMYQFLYEEVP
jgi:hypothetical protein